MQSSQTLYIKTICPTLTKCKKHHAILKQEIDRRVYQENILKDVDNTNRKGLLRKK